MTASDDSPAFILTLPWEIVYKIVDYIHLDDLLTLRLVCQHWDVMVCSMVFKSLTLISDFSYHMDPWQVRINYLENTLHPSRSIGTNVQEIRVETNCVTMDELYLLVQKCSNASTLVVPFLTLRQWNLWLLNDTEWTKKKMKRKHRMRIDDLPAAPELLQLFDRLFLETSLTTLSIPNMMNGDIFENGILHHLSGLQHLDLGHFICQPYLKSTFHLSLLASLCDTCPLLESLVCGLSSAVGDSVDLKQIIDNPPFVWLNMKRLDIHVLSSTLHDDPSCPIDHTKMIAYLSLTMPQLSSLKYVCCNKRYGNFKDPEQELAMLEQQFGTLETWKIRFESLTELHLAGLEVNPYVARLIFVRTITSLHIENCAWGSFLPKRNHPTASWWNSHLATMPNLVTLALAPSQSVNQHRGSFISGSFCIQQILDTLPRLESLRLESTGIDWLGPQEKNLSASDLIRMLVVSPESCGPAHPLVSLNLSGVTCRGTRLFEYLSARCPKFESLTLWAVVIVNSTGRRPMAFHTLLPSPSNDVEDASQPSPSNGSINLYDRLSALHQIHITWLPLIHSRLSTLVIWSGYRRPARGGTQFNARYTHFSTCAAPSFAKDQGHTFKGYGVENYHWDNVHPDIPVPMSFPVFLQLSEHDSSIGVLCKQMRCDPLFYGYPLPS